MDAAANPPARQPGARRRTPSVCDRERFAQAIGEFLEALRAEAGASPATVAAYAADLARFSQWAADRGLASFDALDSGAIVEWLASLRARGLAEASVARHLAALRMCLRQQVADGRLRRDPAALIPAPRLRKSLPKSLAPREVEALFAALERRARAEPRNWRAERDLALLELLYASGARVSEALTLATDGLEPGLAVVRLTGKGRKTRLVPVGRRARAALERWIRGGRLRLPDAHKRREVFLGPSGRPLSRQTAWRRVKLAALDAGITHALSPHGLRHSFATHLIEGGADLRSVQEMLGHASIRTTEVYTAVDAEHLLALHRTRHPRG
jgi:site-specific recombinase XerD